MKSLCASLVAVCLALGSMAVAATPITVGQWYEFGFYGPATPLTDGTGLVPTTNPVAAIAPDPAWTFTLSAPGTLTFLDLFNSTDQFEIFNFGASLGLTSVPTLGGGGCGNDIACALANLDYSRGIFNLAAGSYSITGTQTLGDAGAGVFRVAAATVPEPGSMLLLVLGLGLAGGLLLVRRRRTS